MPVVTVWHDAAAALEAATSVRRTASPAIPLRIPCELR
jgi:hypothetical protein